MWSSISLICCSLINFRSSCCTRFFADVPYLWYEVEVLTSNMARKRRNRSGGEVQKKVQKVEGNVIDKAKTPTKVLSFSLWRINYTFGVKVSLGPCMFQLETQTPRRTRRSAIPESPIVRIFYGHLFLIRNSMSSFPLCLSACLS